MTQKLPIFPLNTVLFPGAPIQLHIFEERYRLMIGRCLEQSSPFGVALIRSGSEVSPDDPWVRRQLELADPANELELGALKRELGGETVPHSVGTTAQISVGESVRLSDGRYYLVASGQRRFRIQYFVQRQPYLIASVAYLPEESSAVPLSAPSIRTALVAVSFVPSSVSARGASRTRVASPKGILLGHPS